MHTAKDIWSPLPCAYTRQRSHASPTCNPGYMPASWQFLCRAGFRSWARQRSNLCRARDARQCLRARQCHSARQCYRARQWHSARQCRSARQWFKTHGKPLSHGNESEHTATRILTAMVFAVQVWKGARERRLCRAGHCRATFAVRGRPAKALPSQKCPLPCELPARQRMILP